MVRLRAHSANSGWYIKITIPDVDENVLVSELRDEKVLSPRTKFTVSTYANNVIFYKEFSSMSEASKFSKRIEIFLKEKNYRILEGW